MRVYLLVAILIFSLFISTTVLAVSEEEVLKDIFRVEADNLESLFAASFLEQVSLNQIEAIVNQYGGALGAVQAVEKNESGYSLQFERGTAPAQISLNEKDKIIGLWFGNYTLAEDNLDAILADLKELPGQLSISVIKNNQEKVFSYHDQKKLAVGSTFKLHVLKKLYDQLEAADKNWSEVVELEEKNKSLASGILQDWPSGTPLTLRTLSNLMISQSDNTAADHLIDYLGREKLETGLDDLNLPFLKTREFFILKFSDDNQLRQEYLNSNLEEKRDVLAELSGRNLENISVGNEPVLIEDLEWYFSTEELAGLIYELKDAPEIKINSGLVDKNNYYLAGYKGGSEPGVLQFTHLLQKTENADIYAVSLTINNSEKAVDSQKAAQLTARLISAVVGL
ncbi:beta-lactamase family protein [Halanaerobium saccharolyticum]|uniref:Beta-lactamase family protein n=1 Tax=Halanaerobium saccharolyticum TaxID=43595 RepID=A0A4R7Z916_9FIRM|nr:serine hydrolase [Halanaerobium saccharolyticum]RAK11906.1 beta-lactamase family protein [Halanaerobium saccharolyticum]TDW07747.1 beta-lactamase family protein [Halanaerobium saccharolyticum]TDX64668.1 beta-lactamase family protein [Halanaerobium saccharolyticum]